MTSVSTRPVPSWRFSCRLPTRSRLSERASWPADLALRSRRRWPTYTSAWDNWLSAQSIRHGRRREAVATAHRIDLLSNLTERHIWYLQRQMTRWCARRLSTRLPCFEPVGVKKTNLIYVHDVRRVTPSLRRVTATTARQRHPISAIAPWHGKSYDQGSVVDPHLW
jgi:hypothetical protein